MDTILSRPTEYCHAPKPDLVLVLGLKNKIKTRAVETEDSPSTIWHSEIGSFPLNVDSQLLQSETLSRSICRQRQVPPANSNSQLADHLTQTDRGEKFLLHEDKELIVFTTASNLSVLKTCKNWFADGTFKGKIKEDFFIYSLSHCYRSARMISIKCLHCTGCLNHELFH